ncbi:uncharacterized protein LOC144581749 [Callithrix jacchus]
MKRKKSSSFSFLQPQKRGKKWGSAGTTTAAVQKWLGGDRRTRLTDPSAKSMPPSYPQCDTSALPSSYVSITVRMPSHPNHDGKSAGHSKAGEPCVCSPAARPSEGAPPAEVLTGKARKRG